MNTRFKNLTALAPHIDIAFDSFYAYLLKDSDLTTYFKDPDQIALLKQKQKEFFIKSLNMNKKELHEGYIKIGEYHQKLKIPYIDFMKGMDILEESFLIYSQTVVKSINLIEEIFKYFRYIKAKTAQGYLNIMLDEDEKDIEVFFKTLSNDEYEESRNDIFDRILLLKSIIRLIKYDEEFDINKEEEAFKNWISTVKFVDLTKKKFIEDLEHRIITSVKKLLQLLKKGEYLEILPIYSSLHNIYKLSLLISNSVSITIADYYRNDVHIDKLTNLYRKDTFIQFLKKEIEISKRNKNQFCVVYIDIDNFKYVNDKYGHLSGDRVLQTIGQLINENIRTSDIGFRNGGDELAIILKGANKNHSITVCKKIKNEIASYEFLHKKESFYIDVSIGIYEYDYQLNEDTHSMMENADKLLYDSKKSGKGVIS